MPVNHTEKAFEEAIEHYLLTAGGYLKGDRAPKDLILQFKKRTLVHFAVDSDEVYMTTRLSGRATHFLPFNRGDGTGAGNPENPGEYKTD